MAKNDLVVKLLLDSGAFGNDIRDAERKAQNFSNSMKNAGKTTGDLTKEIGLSTGAFGKLGSMLTGAGAVVAAVGAFKSVMESTHESSKAFHGVIAGFEGVLNTFQRSLANFDFSSFNRGMVEIFNSAKKAEQALRDVQLSNIAYGVIKTSDTERFKQLEAKYRNPNTTEGERADIKEEATTLLARMRGDANAYYEEAFTTFMDQVIHRNPYVLDTLTADMVSKYIDDASRNRVRNKKEGGMTADMEEYARIQPTLDALYDKYKIAADQYKLGLNNSGSLTDRQKKKWERALAEWKKEMDEAWAAFEEAAAPYQDLIFRNTLYGYNETDLENATKDLNDAKAKLQAITEMENQAAQWVVASDPNGGGSTTDNGKKGSIKWVESEIARLEEARRKEPTGSTQWRSYTKQLYEQKDALVELMAIQEEYDKQFMDPEPEPEYLHPSSISGLKEAIAYQEGLRDTMVVGTREWIEATDVLDSYNVELKEMLELQDKFDSQYTTVAGAAAGSIDKLKINIAALEQARNALTVGSDEWKAKTKEMYGYIAELGVLMEQQAAFESQFNPANKFENLNTVLSSSISMINGLGAAFSACKDEEKQWAGAVITSLGQAASGIMEFIQIKQAAAAASGAASAAGLPYPYNLAAIMSAVATITSIFGTIQGMVNRSGGKFAEGGIVGGTSYSGDKLFAMVNSGEMILNKRQQRNLGNMLGGGGQVEFVISGDSLVGVLNNKRNKTNLTR